MLRSITLNGFLWIALGLAAIGYGVFQLWIFRRGIMYSFPFPGGLVLTGFGMVISGLTNGFTDHSPLGRKLVKVGMLFLIAGLPLLGYGVWRSI